MLDQALNMLKNPPHGKKSAVKCIRCWNNLTGRPKSPQSRQWFMLKEDVCGSNCLSGRNIYLKGFFNRSKIGLSRIIWTPYKSSSVILILRNNKKVKGVKTLEIGVFFFSFGLSDLFQDSCVTIKSLEVQQTFNVQWYVLYVSIKHSCQAVHITSKAKSKIHWHEFHVIIVYILKKIIRVKRHP